MDGPVWGIIRTPSNAAAWSCSSSLILANATKMATNTASSFSSFSSSSSSSSSRMQLSGAAGTGEGGKGLLTINL
uniref:GG17022 n=1 Tax=Drosophila erecta TaxID=7220 RepID=B3P3Z6_DROER